MRWRWAILLGLAACASPQSSTGALDVVVHLHPASKTGCVRVVVQSGGETLSGPMARKNELRVAVQHLPEWPDEVTVLARGYVGTDCSDVAALVRVEETLPQTVRFEPGVVQVDLLLKPEPDGVDQDDDGYASVTSGGSDCDDADPAVNSNAAEACRNGYDDDCDGLADCKDSQCTQACLPPEDCTNGKDDNGDALVDCLDPTCDGKTCADANQCETGPKTCQAGRCTGTPVSCTPGPECTVPRCVPTTGQCTYDTVTLPGQPCDGGTCGQDGQCWRSFPFAPSNFAPSVVSLNGGAVRLNCGHAVFDSSPQASPAFSNWCGAWPSVLTVSQAGAPEAVILPMRSLTIESGNQLELRGSRPVIFAVFGDATLSGDLVVVPRSPDGGSYGDPAGCGRGEDGADTPEPGGGGGGGAFGSFGGHSGDGNLGATGGPGGSANGVARLVPLRGGCSGGTGGNQGSRGGAGGGAVQLSVAGRLTVNGLLAAPGAGAQAVSAGGRGAGGGGSGGALLLEASDVRVQSQARLTANGGGGAQASGMLDGYAGADGSPDSAQPAAGGSGVGVGGQGGSGAALNADAGSGQKGGSLGVSHGGGGGGGGGVGRIRINAHGACTLSSAAVVSPSQTEGGDAGCQ